MKYWAWSVGILVFLFLLSCLGIHVLPWDAVFALVMGWIVFLARSLPNVRVNAGLLISTAVYLLLLIAGAQLFLRWTYRPASDSANQWRTGWTLRGLAVVLLMFAAGTATVGVVHHVTWLARSPEPMFRRHGPRASQVMCASNLRQIGQGLLLYANDNRGAYPPDLSYLVRQADINPEVMICPNSGLDTAQANSPEEAAASVLKPEHCAYVYLGSSINASAPAEVVVIYERVRNHEGEGMNLLFNDGTAEWFALEEAERKLAESVEIVRKWRK